MNNACETWRSRSTSAGICCASDAPGGPPGSTRTTPACGAPTWLRATSSERVSDITDEVQARLSELSTTTLEPAAIDDLRPFGTVRSMAESEILYAAGQENPPFV